MARRLTPGSPGAGIAFAVTLCWLLVACEPRDTPRTEPGKYASLLQIVEAEARAREDTTVLWMRNADNPRLRSLMLDLGLDFVRYNQPAGLICAWRGGGMSKARGFAHPIAGRPPVPPDSIGDRCYRTGPCSESLADGEWTQWTCP